MPLSQPLSQSPGKSFSLRSAVRRAAGAVDLYVLLAYLGIGFLVASLLDEPDLTEPSTIGRIFLLFLVGLVASIFATSRLLRRPVAEAPPVPGATRRIVFAVFCGLAVLGLALLAVSWGIGFARFAALPHESLSFGLRAVSTSLHPLVPLESRLLFTLLPLVLLYPAEKGGRERLWRAALFAAMVGIVVVTQTKFGFVFVLLFGAYLLFGPCSFLSGWTSRIAVLAVLGAIGFGGIGFIQSSIDGVSVIMESSALPPLAVVSPPTAPDTDGVCEGGVQRELPGNAERSLGARAAENLARRTFWLPAQVLRLFVCLREEGWRPAFRGHQAFRWLGGYIPYYRLAYGEFRPGHGSSVSSAVTNAAADGYFNAGYAGTLLAGIVIGGLWAWLRLVSARPGYGPLVWYYRAHLVWVTVQLSVLSVIVSIAPLLALLVVERAVGFRRQLVPPVGGGKRLSSPA